MKKVRVFQFFILVKERMPYNILWSKNKLKQRS